jgi:hypothetical protein
MIAMVVSNQFLEKVKDFVQKRLEAIEGYRRASFVLLQHDVLPAFPPAPGNDDPKYREDLLLVLDRVILILEGEGKIRVHGERSTPQHTAVEWL